MSSVRIPAPSCCGLRWCYSFWWGRRLRFFWFKGRRMPGAHVFRASRLSRGNLWFPTQVAVTPPASCISRRSFSAAREQSIHLAHVASVLIDRNLFFADVMIESSGGASPVRCHGHRKADAVEMKRLIEQYQSDYYRTRGAPPAPAARRTVGHERYGERIGLGSPRRPGGNRSRASTRWSSRRCAPDSCDSSAPARRNPSKSNR